MKENGDIGFKLKGDLARRIRELKKNTGHSAASLGEIALEYFIPAIQRGEFAIINGKLVATGTAALPETAMAGAH